MHIVYWVFYIDRFMGNSILTIPDYETWKPRRQLYDPAFKKRLNFSLTDWNCRLVLSLYCAPLYYSYLKTLLKPFNEITNEFLEKLKPLADGDTKVPMKVHLGEFSLDVISKVYCFSSTIVFTIIICMSLVPKPLRSLQAFHVRVSNLHTETLRRTQH